MSERAPALAFPRTGALTRRTEQTESHVRIQLDGGRVSIHTGLPFFDRLLSAFAFHGRFGLVVKAGGTSEVDGHHTVEDVGAALGAAVRLALGDAGGIERIGMAYVPMDDALVRVSLDVGGRPYLIWNGEPQSVYTPRIDLSVIESFVKAFTDHAAAVVHVDILRGRDYHHVVEAVFTAFGRALRDAVRSDGTALRTGGSPAR